MDGKVEDVVEAPLAQSDPFTDSEEDCDACAI